MKFRALLLLVSLAATAGAQLRLPKAVPAKPPAAKPVPAVPAKPVPAKPIPEPDATAVGALKLLPKDMARRVARIEAREGRPWPDRWYVLVFDPAAPQGLREFVFAEGKLIANRTLSQFADGLAKEDVVGAEAIRINDDSAAGMAVQFALFNNKRLGSVEYELRKVSGVPVWRLTCADAGGGSLGVVELHAGKGSVVHFEGFEKSPVAVVPLPPPKVAAVAKGKDAKSGKLTGPKPSANEAVALPKPKTEKTEKPPAEKATPEKPVAEKPLPEKPLADQPAPAKPFVEKLATEKPIAATPSNREAPPKKLAPVAAGPAAAEPPPKAVPVARTVSEPAPTPAPGAVKRIGNSVKRLFGGDE